MHFPWQERNQKRYEPQLNFVWQGLRGCRFKYVVHQIRLEFSNIRGDLGGPKILIAALQTQLSRPCF